jgi:hypothetical protein
VLAQQLLAGAGHGGEAPQSALGAGPSTEFADAERCGEALQLPQVSRPGVALLSPRRCAARALSACPSEHLPAAAGRPALAGCCRLAASAHPSFLVCRHQRPPADADCPAHACRWPSCFW